MASPVITGIGVVAPTGIGTERFWASARDAASGIGPIGRFDTGRYPVGHAGEINGFDPASAVDPRVTVQTDLWTQFALAATDEALTQARLTPDTLDSFHIGVTTSAASGGNAFGQREIEALWSRGPRFVGPYQSIAWFYAASTGQLSIAHGLRGPCAVVSSESAGGLDALAHSRAAIEAGCPVQICGGTEAPLSPYALTCQLRSGLLASRDAADAYRPFTRDAGGFLPGEGGAVLVLEERDHARQRDAPMLARVCGHAATFAGRWFPVDGAHDWDRGAEALAAAIRLALADAAVPADEVDAVFADAIGIPAADAAEVAALRAALGPVARRIPVTAMKAGLGRSYSAAGVLDAAAAALALRDGVVPPTPVVRPHELAHDIDLVTGAGRRAALRTVLLLARGFGGFCSALVLGAVE
jgi:3-oxoacyl-(acyl-carrier-protein) synthase